MRKLIFVLIFSVLPLVNISSPQARALEPLQPILDCSTTPENSCIEAIYLISSTGVRKKAQLTGRISKEVRTYAPESVLNAEWQEYSIDGYTFSGKAGNAFIPRIFYFPYGNRDCFYTPCVGGNEYIEFAMTATWLNGPPSNTPLPLPYRSSNLACGVKTNPSYCYEPQMFNTDATFEFHLRIPSPFKTVASTGRGVQNYSFNKVGTHTTSSGVTFNRIVASAKPIAYSGYGFAGADIDEYADYETDQFQFWFWGESDARVKRLGACYQTPKLSVVSNIFHATFPMWDSTEQSIYVNLAGPHFKSDGTVNYGLIQIKVSRDLAQCLWGVDVSKSVQAKVSLTYDTAGQQQTQTLATKYLDSEFIVTLTGMHFSSPTLKVQLVEAQVQSSTVQAPQRTSTKVITCTKGKQKKTVKGIKPTCPKGWVTSQRKNGS